MEVVRETIRKGRGFRREYPAGDAPRALPKGYSERGFCADKARETQQNAVWVKNTLRAFFFLKLVISSVRCRHGSMSSGIGISSLDGFKGNHQGKKLEAVRNFFRNWKKILHELLREDARILPCACVHRGLIEYLVSGTVICDIALDGVVAQGR